jgi:acetate---CoA ligase (ADP-forming)
VHLPASPSFLDVQPILDAKSIAVIGASDQPGNLGGETVRRLLKFGFPGPVWPISRTAATVAGLQCFSKVADLPETPQLVIMAIPANGLLSSIEECAAIGVHHGIAYAGGLAEAGEEGAALQRALVALCREKDFRLCGPNCVGTVNATTPVTATFSTALYEMESLLPGGLSMVCQSGGIATSSFSMMQQAGFGFRYLVSSGNEAVITFADYLHAFARDPQTQIIGGYLEGIADGPKFIAALEEARARDKPVVLIKAGITGATARAAQAHTGALVGEDRVVDAVLKEMGVMRVHSVDELVDVMLMLVANRDKRCSGRGVGVITFGGGNGVLAADQCAQNGLSTPTLSEASVEALRPLLVSVASAANPLDLTPTTAFRPGALAQLSQALDIIAAAPEIHSLLFIVGSLAVKAPEISEVIRGLSERSAKPVCVSWPSPPRDVPARLAEHGIHTFLDPARGIRALARFAEHDEARMRPRRPEKTDIAPFDWTPYVPPDTADAVVPEHRCHRILQAAGLDVATSALVTSASEAVRTAAAIGWPVVMKVISAEVTHRAKAGLVAIDLRSEGDVRAAFDRLAARIRVLSVQMEGVYVQKMLPRGHELLVTAFRDPVFGTMVTCGSGGVFTEIIDDVVTERAPVGIDLATHMLDRLRLRRHAADSQGTLPADAAARFIARFSELAVTAPWQRFIFEVNPVLWTRREAVAVDGLLLIG